MYKNFKHKYKAVHILLLPGSFYDFLCIGKKFGSCGYRTHLKQLHLLFETLYILRLLLFIHFRRILYYASW